MLALDLAMWLDLSNSTQRHFKLTHTVLCITRLLLCGTCHHLKKLGLACWILRHLSNWPSLISQPWSQSVGHLGAASPSRLAKWLQPSVWFQPPPYGAEVNLPSSNCQPIESWTNKPQLNHYIGTGLLCSNNWTMQKQYICLHDT